MGCGRCLLPRGRHRFPSSLGGRQGQEGGFFPNFIMVVRMHSRVLHFDIDTIAFA